MKCELQAPARLRRERERRGFNQREAAELAGLAQPAISRLEANWAGSPRARARYAAALGIHLTTEELVAGPLPYP